MVQHGRDRKRRAGRIGKVKFKNRTWTRWDPKPKFGDSRVKKHWDPSKSPSANLESLGLLARPNDLNNSRRCPKAVEKTEKTVVELFDIPESDAPGRRCRYPLNEEDERYIAKCMAKHGDDYLAIRRDIKLNDMQYTETQLRKMGSRYLLLSPSQRRQPVPENLKLLLPGGGDEPETPADDDDDDNNETRSTSD